MKLSVALIFIFILLFVTACQSSTPVCPTDSVTYTTDSSQLNSPVDANPAPTFGLVEINGKEMLFDQVIEGPLCGSSWKGVVYVTCEVEVDAWEEEPTFLEECEFHVEPGSVVYVAAHNNTAYYKGCSCHTGEEVDG
jgi:hypothetical protein